MSKKRKKQNEMRKSEMNRKQQVKNNTLQFIYKQSIALF